MVSDVASLSSASVVISSAFVMKMRGLCISYSFTLSFSSFLPLLPTTSISITLAPYGLFSFYYLVWRSSPDGVVVTKCCVSLQKAVGKMETPAETDKANVSHYRTVSLTKCGKTLISKDNFHPGCSQSGFT